MRAAAPTPVRPLAPLAPRHCMGIKFDATTVEHHAEPASRDGGRVQIRAPLLQSQDSGAGMNQRSWDKECLPGSDDDGAPLPAAFYRRLSAPLRASIPLPMRRKAQRSVVTSRTPSGLLAHERRACGTESASCRKVGTGR